jgi:hypothetical protein
MGFFCENRSYLQIDLHVKHHSRNHIASVQYHLSPPLMHAYANQSNVASENFLHGTGANLPLRYARSNITSAANHTVVRLEKVSSTLPLLLPWE